MGTCAHCGVTVSKKYNRCKPCAGKEKAAFPDRKLYARNWTLLKKYNIDLSGFEVLWLAFFGRCAICDKRLKYPEHKQGQGLDVVAVDHDHKTGNLRGLLCNACNKALGLFKDDKNLLQKAVEYLT